jgi:hypothetical protein
MPNTLYPSTTKGDIVSSNGSSRVRVPVGANGTVLGSVTSAESGLGWIASPSGSSDAMAFISSTSLSTTASMISITGLSAYTNLNGGTNEYVAFLLTGKLKTTNVGSASNVVVAVNAATTTASTAYSALSVQAAINTTGIVKTNSSTSAANLNSWSLIASSSDTDSFTSTNFSQFEMWIFGMFSTSAGTDNGVAIHVESSRVDDDAIQGSEMGIYKLSTWNYGTAEVFNSIHFLAEDPTKPLSVGCELNLYGIKRFGA